MSNIDLSTLSKEELKAMLKVLPAESEVSVKIRKILADFQVVESVQYTKGALLDNVNSIAKTANGTLDKTFEVTSKAVKVYGDVPFKIINNVLGMFDSQLEIKLLKRRIKEELERRSTLE